MSLEQIRTALKGKKTYLTASIAVLSTVLAWAVGEVEIVEASQLVLTAILGVTIRSGISDVK
jgi:hypothetical protein